MFGYVRPDLPYLYIKDEILYKAMYCGVCKGISGSCGQCARMGLSYDVAFLSVLLHNIAGIDVKIQKSHCLTHRVRKKPMAEVDELTKKFGAVNTELAYYKYTDDMEDGDGGKAKRLLFKKGFARAKKKYPSLEKTVRAFMQAQAQTEKAQTESLDRAADATANMLASVCDEILGENATEATHNLFYAVGKWIYLIDALDDYDKDKKKGAYNPFVVAFGEPSKNSLICGKHGEEVRYAFHAIFFDIRENLSKIQFHFNRDLSDNILIRGLPGATKRVMEGDCKACKNKKKVELKDNKGQ